MFNEITCALECLCDSLFLKCHYTCSDNIYVSDVGYKLRSEGKICSILSTQ